MQAPPKKEAKKSVTFKDMRGNTVEPGSRVAFNYSGDVATGTVESITGSRVKIIRDADWHSGGLSTAINRRGIVAIFENSKIAEQLDQSRARYEALYESKLQNSLANLESQEKAIKEKTTELIKSIMNAWDIDEVKDKVTELFGEDVLKHQDVIPDWIKDVMDG